MKIILVKGKLFDPNKLFKVTWRSALSPGVTCIGVVQEEVILKPSCHPFNVFFHLSLVCYWWIGVCVCVLTDCFGFYLFTAKCFPFYRGTFQLCIWKRYLISAWMVLFKVWSYLCFSVHISKTAVYICVLVTTPTIQCRKDVMVLKYFSDTT